MRASPETGAYGSGLGKATPTAQPSAGTSGVFNSGNLSSY